MYKYIAVEGNIGAGKTSIVDLLAKEYNYTIVYEKFENNPFLQKFYANPGDQALAVELFFLSERYHQLSGINHQIEKGAESVISDYFIEKSNVFASVNLDQEELQLFNRFYKMINKTLPKPDLVIYIHRTTGYLEQSIQKRGRNYEQNLPKSYLEKVAVAYREYFEKVKDFPLIWLDCNEIDFFQKPFLERLKSQIIEKKWSNGFHMLHFE